jgi:cobalt-zinc-cadmium efflux system membrane fusion protein
MPSVASADKAGIRTDRAETREGRPLIEAICETQYNLNTMARVTPLADGVIRKVWRDLGDSVKAGDVLAELHSAEVANAKSAFLSAAVQEDILRKAFEREKRLMEQNISAEKDYLEAEAAYRMARLDAANKDQKLINLGLTDTEIEDISRTMDTSATLLVRAPFDGTLVERNAVMGESIQMGQSLFTIADLSTFWLVLSVPSDFAGEIGVGQPVEARFPELPGMTIRGTIDWVDPSVDPRSRMIRARAIVEDAQAAIRKGLFGEATIAVGNRRPMSLVPGAAIQQYEGATYVFVRNEADLYSLRRVQLGSAQGDRVEILSGLQASEPVVVEGAFVVMSEFLKSRLGAGCAGH